MSRGQHCAVAVLAASLLGAPAGAAGPAVRNLSVTQEADRVTVRYDLEAGGPVPLRLVGSSDGGRTFTLNVRSVTGDAGPAVPPGKGRTIVWRFRQDHPQGLDRVDVTTLVPPLSTPNPQGLDRVDVTLDVAIGGDRYLPIPIRGRFGVELDEDYLKECLRLADASKSGFLVLEIESPGGSVLEMEDMLDLLAEWRAEHPSVRVVAFARGETAHAAALFAAAAADAVFLSPEGWIGGSAVVRPGGAEVSEAEHAVPKELRTKLAALAGRRGISQALLDATLKPARLAVALAPGAGERTVGVGSKVPPMHTLITDGSKPVRLTGSVAVLSGFAAAVAKDYQDLGRQLGHPDWSSAGEAAREASRGFAADVARVLGDYESLSAMLRDALAAAPSAEDGGQLTSGDAAELRELVDEVFELADAFPFVQSRAAADFPKGAAGLNARIGPEPPRDPSASASGGPSQAAKKARVRKGIHHTWSAPPVARG